MGAEFLSNHLRFTGSPPEEFGDKRITPNDHGEIVPYLGLVAGRLHGGYPGGGPSLESPGRVLPTSDFWTSANIEGEIGEIRSGLSYKDKGTFIASSVGVAISCRIYSRRYSRTPIAKSFGLVSSDNEIDGNDTKDTVAQAIYLALNPSEAEHYECISYKDFVIATAIKYRDARKRLILNSKKQN